MARVPVQISMASEAQRQALKNLFAELNIGELANPSRLMQAIAEKTYMPIPWNEGTQAAMMNAIVYLMAVSPGDAQQLLDALLPLPWEKPARERLESLKAANAAWADVAIACINARTPFVLNYKGKDRKVLYAEVAYRDLGRYIHAWIEEPNPQCEVPQLTHNRLFSLETSHLDREPTVTPRPEDVWREDGLDYVDVQFMAQFTYKPKPQDLKVKRMSSSDNEQDVWHVERRVTNMLWFMQSIARYGDRCIVLGPDEVRRWRVNSLRKELRQYE